MLGSSGSVGPHFVRQIAEGGPVTVTDFHSRRYFLTLNQAVRFLLTALSNEFQSGIYIPDLAQPRLIEDLACFLISKATTPDCPITITFTELRSGDKIVESLLAPGEQVKKTAHNDLFEVDAPIPPNNFGGLLAEQVACSLENRDLPALLKILQKAVPEYCPSTLLQKSAKHGIGRLAPL